MTSVRVNGGACGFVTRIRACKEERRGVSITLVSDCEAVLALNEELNSIGPFTLRDIVSKGIGANRIFEAAARCLSHAACPVVVGVLKAAEVEMGLNVPSDVHVEFLEDANPNCH